MIGLRTWTILEISGISRNQPKANAGLSQNGEKHNRMQDFMGWHQLAYAIMRSG
jgi:hypothetical protein